MADRGRHDAAAAWGQSNAIRHAAADAKPTPGYEAGVRFSSAVFLFTEVLILHAAAGRTGRDHYRHAVFAGCRGYRRFCR